MKDIGPGADVDGKDDAGDGANGAGLGVGEMGG